jgi:hypothetical protein
LCDGIRAVAFQAFGDRFRGQPPRAAAQPREQRGCFNIPVSLIVGLHVEPDAALRLGAVSNGEAPAMLMHIKRRLRGTI